MKPLAVILLLLTWTAPAGAVSSAELSLILDYGHPDEHHGAILELVRLEKGIPKLAVASVLRREDLLEGKERLELIEALGEPGLTLDTRVLAFLQREILRGESETAEKAFEGLLGSYNRAVIPVLSELFRVRPLWRERIGWRIASLYRDRIKEEVHSLTGRSFYPHDASRLAREGRLEPLFIDIYEGMAADPDQSVRLLAADRLRYFADERADGLLWKLVEDEDMEVAAKALWSLGMRREEGACSILIV